MRHAVVGEAFIDHVPVFEDDGYTKHSGLTASDFTITVWVNGIEVPLVIDIEEIDSSGEYLIGVVPTIEGFWKIETMVNFNNEILVSEVEVGDSSIDSIAEQLKQIMDGATGLFVSADSLHARGEDFGRILGLLHHNAIVDNQLYDSNGQLIGFRLRCFDSKDHVPSTPGGSEALGKLFEYTATAVFSGMGTVNMYRMEKVL